MAMIKIWTKEGTDKVRFDTLYDGEVFVYNDEIYMKANRHYKPINAVRLSDGLARWFDDDLLVRICEKSRTETDNIKESR